MKPYVIALLLALGTAHANGPEQAAEQAARAWLSQVDAGQYESSWSHTASLFKRQVTVDQWKNALAGVRQPLGAVQSRQLDSATYAKSLPGAPDGDYVVLQFKTVFEHKAAAVETVTPMLDDGAWRVSGYYIR